MRSIARALGRTLVLASACIALQATSCAIRELRNDRFNLAACPPATFVLPSDLRDGPYHLASEARETSGWGSMPLDWTFATYAFTDINVHGLGPRPVALRLVRDTSCSLDVLRTVGGPDSLRTEQSAAIARVTAASAGTQSLEPPRKERIPVDHLRAWTKRTAGSAP
jgi:hypothetical protein